MFFFHGISRDLTNDKLWTDSHCFTIYYCLLITMTKNPFLGENSSIHIYSSTHRASPIGYELSHHCSRVWTPNLLVGYRSKKLLVKPNVHQSALFDISCWYFMFKFLPVHNPLKQVAIAILVGFDGMYIYIYTYVSSCICAFIYVIYVCLFVGVSLYSKNKKMPIRST